jgi:asparagine synthase (glutamine-hydrolysing)
MCGIAGIVSQDRDDRIGTRLPRMIAMLHHRGPDACRLHVEPQAGLAHTRLSVIDVRGGDQPMANDDRTLWITFNGEIFNYVELRECLERRRHRFRTQSDTEVLLRLYDERGRRALADLNGDWAFAIWNSRSRTLLLSRDRMGVRPLYYAIVGRALLFASEIKALFADPRVPREIDPEAVDDIFTVWSPLASRTMFKAVRELPPGHSLTWHDGSVAVSRDWHPDFTRAPRETLSDADAEDRLRAHLTNATRIRLRADVPVGAYVSGGLDSSIVAALAAHQRRDAANDAARLRTFSLGFDAAEFDERPYQRQVVGALGTEHHELRCTPADIVRVFPQVVWHAETPMLRTAPAPLYLLARFVRECGHKVVLTGEGADEVFGGYSIFKEAKLRRMWSERGRTARRAALVKRLYPHLPHLQRQSTAFLQSFFHAAPDDLAHPCFSHLPRWSLTSRLKVFFSDGLRASVDGRDAIDEVRARLPAGFALWDPLARAQYLELTQLLPGYLLSSQGDRMAMAHGVETRFPYLDPDVVAFGTSLPERLVMHGLREKVLLRRVGRSLMPPSVWQRTKQPYRAPGAEVFVTNGHEDYVNDLLSPSQIRRDGLFNPDAVSRLVRKFREGRAIGVKDDMALVGILSTQLVIHHFINHFGTDTHGALYTGTEALHRR